MHGFFFLYDDGPSAPAMAAPVGGRRRREAEETAVIAAARLAQQDERLRTVVTYINMCALQMRNTTNALLLQYSCGMRVCGCAGAHLLVIICRHG